MTVAVVTMVRDEAVFLPLWLAHYGARFGPGNLFVIDDGSGDGCTRDPRIANLVSRKRAPLDEDDRAALVGAFHEELLGFYDTVIYTDADEFIVLDPDAGPDLAGYIHGQAFGCRAPIGLEVVHRRSREEAIDFRRPVLEQRRFVRFDIEYTKPLVSRRPIRWQAGFHHCDGHYGIDCSMVLFHLRSVDADLSRRRIRTLNAIGFSRNALRKNHDHQFRLPPEEYLALLYGADEAEFDRAAERDPDRMLMEGRDRRQGPLCRLGARWRGVLRLDPGMPPDREMPDRKMPDAPARPAGLDRPTLDRLFAAATGRMIASVPDRPRNEPCPCGSDRRFKHCHGPAAVEPARLAGTQRPCSLSSQPSPRPIRPGEPPR